MFPTRYNLDLIESQYQRWRQDPHAVDESWRTFFEGFELGQDFGPPRVETTRQQIGVIRLIDAYRSLGHMFAHLDPLSEPTEDSLIRDLADFDLTAADLDANFETSIFRGFQRGTLRQLIAALQVTYCGSIGVEYMHIQDAQVRQWLEQRMELCHNK